MYIQKKKTYVEPQVKELALIEMTNLCSGSGTDSETNPKDGIDYGPQVDESELDKFVPKPDTNGSVWGD